MISQQVIDAVEETSYTEDQKQAFYLYLLENDVELSEKNNVKKLVSTWMWNRAKNERWIENNRERLRRENEDAIRDTFHQNEKYAADPAELYESEEYGVVVIDQLSDVQRNTFQKIFLDGYTPDELAAEEGVARNAIDQRVHTIKKLAQEKLNG